ncbi:hypothetical protein NUW54_g8383 [Trametes sanguinea]|uniref:Uncharacterized protein n=1 Tax=Trametes sanguinea TaxID=158606 RepID=A0ACC1PF77_9APHY|nr:hypothetical protein NUW54_g8383 [Trametes sanguinea]
MPPPHKLSSSSTAPELYQPGSSPPENGIKMSQPPAHTRRHSRLHSRNLSIYFPRPGSLPSTSIAEDGAQELDFSEAPEYDEGVPIPSASPGPGQRTFREGFTFGARPPSSASSATHPMSPMKPSGSGASRRGHHHKHSLSHNFFSFLEPVVAIGFLRTVRGLHRGGADPEDDDRGVSLEARTLSWMVARPRSGMQGTADRECSSVPERAVSRNALGVGCHHEPLAN